MKALKRAIQVLTSKKTRSLLFLLVFFVIGNFIIVMYGMSQTANTTKLEIRRSMKPIVEYYVDEEQYYRDLRKQHGDSFYKYIDVTLLNISYHDVAILSEDFRVLGVNALINDSVGSLDMSYIDHPNKNDYYPFLNQFSLVGNGFENMIEVVDGTYEVIEGRFYTQAEIDSFAQVGLITDVIAGNNQIQVGDSVRLVKETSSQKVGGSYIPFDPNAEVNLELYLEIEIIGIYKNNKRRDSTMASDSPMYPDLNNTILMPGSTILKTDSKIYNSNVEKDYCDGKLTLDEYNFILLDLSKEALLTKSKIATFFLLEDAEEVEPFIEDYKRLVTQYKVFYANNAEYEKIVNPLRIVQFVSNAYFTIGLLVSIAFVTLIALLNFKMREYEIGLQLALGVGKIKIMTQMSIELCLVGIIGFGLAFLSSNTLLSQIDQSIKDYLIADSARISDYERTISSHETAAAYFKKIDTADFYEKYHTAIDIPFVLSIYGLLIAIIAVSTVVPMIQLTRYSPKKILMNRE